MQSVNISQVISILEEVGVQPGDRLLIHSALHFLGRPEGGVEMYLKALAVASGVAPGEAEILREALFFDILNSHHITLTVPTFTLAFARGEPFDPHNTPSQDMGVFSEYVRCLPGARRTLHPMQSVAAIGEYASDLAGRDTLSAFDPGSAFERMLELDFKLLLLGAEIHSASIVHYCEQRAAVPYRYWKDFTGQVRIYSGGGEDPRWETRTCRMYARDLALNPRLNLAPIRARLIVRSHWRSRPLNYGFISQCRLRDFVAAADELLGEDPWVLVENRPAK